MRRTMQIHKSWHQPARIYPEPPEPKHLPSKNTKRWCRGRKGVPHKKAWVLRSTAEALRERSSRWYDLRCTVCFRRFDWCAFLTAPCKCGNHEKEKG